MPRMSFATALMVFLYIAGMGNTVKAQITFNWVGGGGDNNWSTSANWSPSEIPGSSDLIIISAVDSVVADIDVTIDSISFSGGFINASNKITVNSGITWTDGDLVGNDTLVIGSSAVVNIVSANLKNLYNLTLRNEGTINWVDDGRISLRNKSTIFNASGALFDVQTDALMDYVQLDTGGFFKNEGTLRKSAGSGLSTIDPTFYNTGTVDVNTGTLRFERGDTLIASTGNFDVAASATVELSERIFTLDGVIFSGGGTTEFLDATFTLATSGMTINSGGTVQFNSASCIIEGSGPLTVSGTLNITAGRIGGSGSFVNNGTILFTGTSNKSINGRTLNNNNTVDWTGTGAILLTSNGVFRNESGANFNIQVNSRIDEDVELSASFVNAGTITKSVATSTTNFEIAVTNTGTINTNIGRISFEDGSSNVGAVFNTVSGATMDFNSGAHSMDGVTFNGGGAAEFIGSSLAVSGSGITVGSTGNLLFVNNDINGAVTITNNGTLEWRGDRFTGGAGNIVNNGTFNVTGAGTKWQVGWTITNNDSMNWSGIGEWRLQDNAAIVNTVGATFHILDDASIDWRISNGGTFNNQGTIKKSTASGETIFDATLSNSGTILVQSGSIEFQRTSGSVYSGTINVAPGSIVQFAVQDFSLNNMVFTGGGTVEAVNNTITLSGSGLTVDDGTQFGQTGLEAELVCSADFNNNGTFRWQAGTVMVNAGATLTNGSTGLIDIRSDKNLSDGGDGANTLLNQGNIQKSSGTGSSTLALDVTNSGTIGGLSGTLAFQNTFVNTSTGTLFGTAALNFSGVSSFSNSGDTSPGNSSIAALAFTGNFSQGASSEFLVTLNGTTAGSGHDQLLVSGNATLDGTLTVVLNSGYSPALNDSFIVLAHTGSRSGTFGTLNGPTIGGNPMFEVAYRNNYVVLRTIALPRVTANVRVFLEGAWRSGSMTTQLRDDGFIPSAQPYSGSPWSYTGSENVAIIPASVTDWVLVELRSGTGAETVVERRAAFILSDGTVVDTSGSGVVTFPTTSTGTYYVVVYHRNHLSVMTATAQVLTTSSSQYDFTTGQSQAYSGGADGMIDLGSGVFALFAGETNDSGIVTAADKSVIISNLNTTGYRDADTNFSGIVTNADKSAINNNLNAATQVP